MQPVFHVITHYLPIEECEDSKGCSYTRYTPCPICEGSDNQPQWVNLDDLVKLMHRRDCPHEHTSYQCNMRFGAGDILDDITEVCNACGAIVLLELSTCYIQTLMQVAKEVVNDMIYRTPHL